MIGLTSEHIRLITGRVEKLKMMEKQNINTARDSKQQVIASRRNAMPSDIIINYKKKVTRCLK
jgi:hypothetical protein